MAKSEYTKARDALLKRIKRLENAGFAIPREKVIPSGRNIAEFTALSREKILELSGYLPGTVPVKARVERTPRETGSESETEQEYTRALRRLSKNMRIKIADLKSAVPAGKISAQQLQRLTTVEALHLFPSLRQFRNTSPPERGRGVEASVREKDPEQRASERRKPRKSRERTKEPERRVPADRGDSEFYRRLKSQWKTFSGNFPESLAGKEEISVRELREYFGRLKPEARESFKQALSGIMTERPLRRKDVLSDDNIRMITENWDSVKTLFPDKFMSIREISAADVKRFLKSLRVKEASEFLEDVNRRVLNTSRDALSGEGSVLNGSGMLPGTPGEYGTYTQFILERYDELIAQQTMISFRQAAQEMKSAFLYIVAREGQNAEEYVRKNRATLEEEITGFCPVWVIYKKEQMEDAGLYDPSLFGFTAGGYEFEIF